MILFCTQPSAVIRTVMASSLYFKTSLLPTRSPVNDSSSPNSALEKKIGWPRAAGVSIKRIAGRSFRYRSIALFIRALVTPGLSATMNNAASAMCTSCHNLDGWMSSSHATSGVSLSSATRDTWDNIPYSSVSAAAWIRTTIDRFRTDCPTIRRQSIILSLIILFY